MGWPFCPQCHTILSINQTGTVSCVRCTFTTTLGQNQNTFVPPSTTTVSTSKPIPPWAKSDEEQRLLLEQSGEGPKRATVEEPCVKCGAKEVGFYTVQLRSVDEGQTVFYECPECRHTWSVNN